MEQFWGGLVVLNMLNELPSNIGQIILLNPLTHFPSNYDIKGVLKEFVDYENKSRNKEYVLDSLVENAIHIKNHNAPTYFIDNISKYREKMLIIHPRNDVLVMPEDTRKFVILLDEKVSYLEQDDYHWFTQRTLMIKTVFSFINK